MPTQGLNTMGSELSYAELFSASPPPSSTHYLFAAFLMQDFGEETKVSLSMSSVLLIGREIRFCTTTQKMISETEERLKKSCGQLGVGGGSLSGC